MTDEPKLFIRPPSMPWDIRETPESTAKRAEFRAREIEIYRDRSPEHLSMAMAQHAMFDGALRVLSGRSPKQVRKQAAFVVRCQDCDGRAFGWVTWTQGRPLFMGNEDREGKRAVVTLLDEPEFAAPDLCCRRQRYRFGYDISMDAIPGPGAPSVEARVVHADAKRCAL